MHGEFNFLGEQFLDLLFPKLCVGCNINGELLCANCFGNVDFVEQFCIGCGDISERGFTHAQCQAKLLPTRLLCVCDYKQKLAAKLITSLKYDLIKDLDSICAQIIFKFMIERGLLPDEDFIITYVPMHKSKQVLRGFNQSELIANQLGRILDMPVLPLLQKIRKTPAQMTLTQKERQTNLKDAFEAKNCKNKKILLIDDVITTGSTLLECSKTLLTAGAKEVQCLAFAKD